MNNPAPPWLPILRAALDEEYADRPRIATLATINAEHHPRARTVILRQIDNDGTLWITSSAQAQKNAQLRQSPFAELVLYLSTTRQQFRLAGKTTIIGQGEDETFRQQFWQSLSDSARAMFFWPTAGEPLGNDAVLVASSLPSTASMPESFELIALHAYQVEHLVITGILHERTRWRKQGNWKAEMINP